MASDDQSPREVELKNDDVEELVFARRGWCTWIPCLGGDRSVCFQRMRPAEMSDDPWWIRGWKKVREWSEIVAGPRWKTFIRRFNKNRPDRAGGCFAYGRLRSHHHHHQQTGKFRYDELSYSLNFDQGMDGPFDEDGDGGDGDFLRRDFSSRYASVPASAKSSMDLGHGGGGGGGGPSFT